MERSEWLNRPIRDVTRVRLRTQSPGNFTFLWLPRSGIVLGDKILNLTVSQLVGRKREQ